MTKVRDRWYYIFKRYQVLQQDYEDLYEKQGGRCPICNEPLNSDVAVDHDHITGKVRGLLHASCNRGLGFFKDSVGNLLRAIKYLLTTR